jgi:hypothetical protein
MELKTLDNIKSEIKRFNIRLDAAYKRIKDENRSGAYYSGTKETGALKRAALDLKMELTKITK